METAHLMFAPSGILFCDLDNLEVSIVDKNKIKLSFIASEQYFAQALELCDAPFLDTDYIFKLVASPSPEPDVGKGGQPSGPFPHEFLIWFERADSEVIPLDKFREITANFALNVPARRFALF